ncbi:MAG TPA: tRNA (guanosine(37)-N1)-methyltransferase TrmD [Patescibacteria group bacterium]|nr:tRNA (guanosine(37)-N1)-methyltransferase TrmD [Patescibacteria group bacterium]
MQIDIITLFPELFEGVFSHSIVHTAQTQGIVSINIHHLRTFAIDTHGTVDDKPYGGGVGMVMRCEPVFDAVESLFLKPATKIILLSPQGKPYTQKKARALSKLSHIILICGHYEGVDERIRTHLADEEISLGDFVLTGGEIPAMAVVDSVVRLRPGVLEKEAHTKDSFSLTVEEKGKKIPLLEYPQYTRPATFRGWDVPKVLLSGNHQEIDTWRKNEAVRRTKRRRPEFFSTD